MKKNRLSKIERSVYDKQNISDNTITIESIIEKLGFDPREKAPVEIKSEWVIDDSKPTPVSVLTREESKSYWIMKYYKSNNKRRSKLLCSWIVFFIFY